MDEETPVAPKPRKTTPGGIEDKRNWVDGLLEIALLIALALLASQVGIFLGMATR